MGRTTTGSVVATSGYEPGGNGESRFPRRCLDRYMIGTYGAPMTLQYRPMSAQSGEPLAALADDVQLGGDLAERRNLRRLELQGNQRLDRTRVGVE
jgi:hypothetical protein